MTAAPRRPSATVRFYTGFFVVLAVAIALVYAIGFRAGAGRTRVATSLTGSVAYRVCLRMAKIATRDERPVSSAAPTAYLRYVRLLARAQACAHEHGLPYLRPVDISEVTGVNVADERADPADAMWRHPVAPPSGSPTDVSQP